MGAKNNHNQYKENREATQGRKRHPSPDTRKEGKVLSVPAKKEAFPSGKEVRAQKGPPVVSKERGP